MSPPHDVVLLTTGAFLAPKPDDWYVSTIQREEGLLGSALAAHGLRVMRADWADPTFDWHDTRCAVFCSTWDYFFRFAEFSPWLDRVATQTRLCNALDILRWNIDKHYLADLDRAGVAVVPTRFVERGESADLAMLARAEGWDEIVVKPAVSGNARLTFRARGDEIAALQPTFDRCVASEAMMIQRFEPLVLTQGEVSLMVMAGRFTHAVRKTPKPGDFRVQVDHGGALHPHTASAAEIEFAERAVAACPRLPIYARVDAVVTPGGCRVMELELIEPELFFRFHPPAAQALADAIAMSL